ncbi:alpha/beta hydrolase [Methylophilus sp. 5]|uniref:alpha/beta hydrolase n=1 Tax=Methylophilus sp. 5 TaxID=1112274 RepID=UPI0004B29501|nr:alpha/beta hydrolase-fold protein [Methylophilus sp. 5]
MLKHAFLRTRTSNVAVLRFSLFAMLGWLLHLSLAQADTLPLPTHWAPTQLSNSLSFDLTSSYTGQQYRIVLDLPHKAPPAGGYPVLWALDGLASVPMMEVARPRPPYANESAQWRKKVGEEPAGLIVGIGYASGVPFDINARAQDYTPATSAKTGDSFSTKHGGADAFLKFLTLELRPLLAQHFELNPEKNTLFGFSYGGLFTLYTLSTQPQHFQRYWAASPSLWFGEHQTIKQLPDHLTALQQVHTINRVMITVGTDEQFPASFASAEQQAKLQSRTMVDNAERFATLLQQTGLPASKVQFQRLQDHDHEDMLMHGARAVPAFAFAP